MLITETIRFFVLHHDQVLKATVQHLYLVAIPMVLCILIAVPLTILATRIQKLYPWLIGFSNAMQTIPSLALLALLIAIGSGIGLVPTVVALFLYALMPIIRNTFVGINGVSPEIKDAAMGMGVTNWQLLWMIELPLALKVIIAGIRSALVGTIGFATLGALIGAGGLGSLILRGLSMASNDIVLAGTLPAMLMAFLAEFLMSRLEILLTPRGLRTRKG
ncbi:Binding-protein-dependent transport system inner membrane component [Acididesulfobacillus acetoxydans]|uniref:Binding-protein-dependent transport system inner membrane component n=1 Tax=Acididesulfobacillus acetoxydans TaxID=1561005 RepID=A0A8S0W7D7_9FIRM|nr:ABC transporter permease [Acididesulfobacillus acetoxydans]CAA7600629.1 Binding-protein-dependent transport system inner membrane component [Acididesulfobacillus acetoxydans]CEJ09410.1 Carnitine transport permease protein OpuCB [Acididesulfobacillus acetoxydans]